MTSEATACVERRLVDEAATRSLAEQIACVALPGDRILLGGDLGSGKTTFARAFLRCLASDPALEVPSPTFTLVQGYTFGTRQVAHLDLYRIAGAEELDELGLDELGQSILLVEWPERAPGAFEGERLEVQLSLDTAAPDGRDVRLVAHGEGWARRLARTEAIRRVLEGADLAAAQHRPLAGDASTRRYERLMLPDRSLVLMDAPAQPDPGLPGTVPYSRQVHLAEDVRPYVAIAEALAGRGFSAPRIIAADLEAGVLVTEDLGGEGIVDADRRPIPERYVTAAELLAELHAAPWSRHLSGRTEHELPPFDLDALVAETMLTPQWFAPRLLGKPLPDEAIAEFDAAWRSVLADYAEGRRETSLVLRDFHSPNIIWLPERTGTKRIGLLDFQDALFGPAAYDIASLAMDARVDVPEELYETILRRYAAARAATNPVDEGALRADVAVMAAQRTTKIMGIFTRLAERDGKPAYLAHLPRLHAYLDRALAEPLLQPVQEWYDRHLPADRRRSAAS